MRSEYSHFGVSTSSGDDPTRARILSVDERSGVKVTAEPSANATSLQGRLRAAKEALARAESAKRVAADLVRHLEQQAR